MKKLAISLLAIALLAGCHSSRYTTSQHIIGTAKIAEPTKEGKACRQYFLLFLSSTFVDMSFETARKNGNITEVSSVEQRERGFIPFFYERCTVVLGN